MNVGISNMLVAGAHGLDSVGSFSLFLSSSYLWQLAGLDSCVIQIATVVSPNIAPFPYWSVATTSTELSLY